MQTDPVTEVSMYDFPVMCEMKRSHLSPTSFENKLAKELWRLPDT